MSEAIATDLVEYLLVTIPGPQGLAAVGGELVRMVAADTIRVLDLAVVTVDAAGRPEIVDVEGLDALRALTSCAGFLLSSHDLDLVALALAPGDWAAVVVVEDRWAQPLARAATAAGGEVRAGERIARERVEAALARVTGPIG